MAWDLTGFKTLKNISALRNCLTYLKTAADSIVTAHNSLTGLQGGAANEYNHLTNAQLTIATQAASMSQSGYLLLADWAVFNGKQGALTLTTTGSSGAATLVGTTLNIPQYSTDIAASIVAATAKTTPVDADLVGLVDSEASNVLKKLSWANSKATLKTYFDTLYSALWGCPVNSQSAAYTLVLSDAGKIILHPSADTTARTFTIPANASVAYTVGTMITFTNQNGAGVVTIAITSDTMRLAGAGTTGSRTLAANGTATAQKITTTEWLISGNGLT